MGRATCPDRHLWMGVQAVRAQPDLNRSDTGVDPPDFTHHSITADQSPRPPHDAPPQPSAPSACLPAAPAATDPHLTASFHAALAALVPPYLDRQVTVDSSPRMKYGSSPCDFRSSFRSGDSRLTWPHATCKRGGDKQLHLHGQAWFPSWCREPAAKPIQGNTNKTGGARAGEMFPEANAFFWCVAANSVPSKNSLAIVCYFAGGIYCNDAHTPTKPLCIVIIVNIQALLHAYTFIPRGRYRRFTS